ncbi:MAG: exodeoxyribonuclease VII small subunit [Acidimicrobiaceae bacterium]|jgi:exodeoxyribonuclease VII small subunit|nr:exodeoxyribonuclease VII small subunit [Dehalococcoidia bacterium]MBU39073.1 exodeoxyribonuclease VII small subunit [Acidimicrobiaceae bacterium]MEC7909813.1 exodeoxyribonuclease VII small subunit [Actinomycetota bacterium]|tara:strand:+ start:594 stop:821 length:228 start_codon:yes stop_codon:yes gene_type:complete
MTKETKKADEGDEMNYSLALKELQEILTELESDQVDIDELAKKVERANELLQECQKRLTSTQMQVEEIIEVLNED